MARRRNHLNESNQAMEQKASHRNDPGARPDPDPRPDPDHGALPGQGQGNGALPGDAIAMPIKPYTDTRIAAVIGRIEIRPPLASLQKLEALRQHLTTTEATFSDHMGNPVAVTKHSHALAWLLEQVECVGAS